MKTLLNCDQVFDVLTRDSFPSGSEDDDAVRLHLQGCHQCRELAEALRPAVGLMHESMDEAQRAGLPEYHANENVDFTDRVMQQIQVAQVQRAQVWFSANQLSAAMVVAIVVTAALCGFAFQYNSKVNRSNFQIAAATIDPDRLQLASLDVSEECLLPPLSKALTHSNPLSFDATRYQCCTRCHREGRIEQVSAQSVLQNGGCFVCHTPIEDS